MTITIFTPTYNRAYILPALYESLCYQTCKDFEWIIVDDGSTDNTEKLVKSWLSELIFPIHYIRQKNGGKHRAINRGVQEANGELFFIVDSDDILPSDSVERIINQYASIKGDASFGGVCGLKAYFNGEKVGGECDFGLLDCTSIDFRFKLNMRGDMAEVIRTSVLKEFPFPEIDNEKFCPEALVFNRIALKYKLRYFYERIYLCEYLEDGLTASIVKIRMNSPIASCICYEEQAALQVPFKIKLRSAINYWRFWACLSNHRIPYISFKWWWTMPVGLLMHFKDNIQVKK